MNNSKESNIVITASYISGVTFRKITRWEKLSRVWMGQYDPLGRKECEGRKAVICKTSYGQFGRECQHNQSQVPIDLARVDWTPKECFFRDGASGIDPKVQRFGSTKLKAFQALPLKSRHTICCSRNWEASARQGGKKMEISNTLSKRMEIPKLKLPLDGSIFHFYVFLLFHVVCFLSLYSLSTALPST